MLEWFRRLTAPKPHMGQLARYKQLRLVGLQLNHRLVDTLPPSALEEGGKKLGILRKKTLVLESEDTLAVLMDYCIYDFRRGGLNAIDRYLAESPPAPGSDEMVILQAMRQARYSLFVVEWRESGVGVQVRDLLSDESLFLMDVGLGRTAPIGLVLSTRVFSPEGIGQTTGAALPVSVMSPEERERFLNNKVARFKGRDFHTMPPAQASDLAVSLIRSALQGGAEQHIQYSAPGEGPRRGPQASESVPQIGRNDRCPCGSPKKYKNCCGRRR